MAGHLGDEIESILPSRNFAWVAMQTTASFKITVCGIEELKEHCDARVSHVVSILDPTWPVPSALHTYREHERLELRFDDVIQRVPGKVPPGPQHIRQLLALGRCRYILDAASTSSPRRSSRRSPNSMTPRFGHAVGRRRSTSAAMSPGAIAGAACASIRATAAGERENSAPQ